MSTKKSDKFNGVNLLLVFADGTGKEPLFLEHSGIPDNRFLTKVKILSIWKI